MLTQDNNRGSGPEAQAQQNTNKAPCDTHQAAGPTAAQVAHELNNLLDGGMRNLDLARSSLQHLDLTQDGFDNQATLTRLQTARTAMGRMATLIRRWMHPDSLPWHGHDAAQTLDQAVDQAVRLLTPAASSHQAEFQVCLSDEVAPLPAGPVYTIVANALRNCIQAIAHTNQVDLKGRRFQIQIKGCLDDGIVELTIDDDGPGLDPSVIDDQGLARIGITTKPDGNGVGLALCQDIAASLGGHVMLAPGPSRGATFTLRYPLGGAVAGLN